MPETVIVIGNLLRLVCEEYGFTEEIALAWRNFVLPANSGCAGFGRHTYALILPQRGGIMKSPLETNAHFLQALINLPFDVAPLLSSFSNLGKLSLYTPIPDSRHCQELRPWLSHRSARQPSCLTSTRGEEVVLILS